MLLQIDITAVSKWLIFLESTVILDEYFSDIFIPQSCEFLVAQGDSQMEVNEVYHLHQKGSLQMVHMGTWTPDSQMVLSSKCFHDRRGNLQGATLKGTFIPEVSTTD